jgi:hypothetical protein
MSDDTIEVTIRIRFNRKLTTEAAREFVQEMDYEIKDTTGKYQVVDTEVVDDNIISVDPDEPDYTDYIPLEECIESGQHLQDCDQDGFCNACGCQDAPEKSS